jgi:hypothetical protein
MEIGDPASKLRLAEPDRPGGATTPDNSMPFPECV